MPVAVLTIFRGQWTLYQMADTPRILPCPSQTPIYSAPQSPRADSVPASSRCKSSPAMSARSGDGWLDKSSRSKPVSFSNAI